MSRLQIDRTLALTTHALYFVLFTLFLLTALSQSSWSVGP
jgi:hypothetical protein